MGVVSAQDDDIYDTYYYEYSEVTFGTSVDGEGNVEGESRTFKLGKAGADFIVVVYNENPFKPRSFLWKFITKATTLLNLSPWMSILNGIG